jgi:transcriptional regulator with XRE-family HTH domain
LPFCRFALKAKRPQSHDYPEELKTLGDHLRKKRLDLKLFQRDVAQRLGVNETTIYNWEKNRSTPSLRFMPRIIKFLGYFPLKCQGDPIERLKFYKLVNSLSYKRLGKLMGRDPGQLADWLSRRVGPCKRNMERIVKFLAEVYRDTTY